MLNRANPDFRNSGAVSSPSIPSSFQSAEIKKILAVLARQSKVIILCTVVFLALGIFHANTSVPRYTASTSILIDSKKAGYAAQNSLEGSLIFDTGAIDSQVQIILSDKIVLAVVDKLRLYKNREFMVGGSSLLGSLASAALVYVKPAYWLGDDASGYSLEAWVDGASETPDASNEALRQYAAYLVGRSIVVNRLARTYVINIGMTSTSPDLAARIANELADQYLADQLESRFDVTRRASVWLEDRLEELKKKSLQADMAVQQFKVKHNLVAASGRLVNEQQLSELNTQLILARGEAARLQARYERLQEMVDGKLSFASVNESLGSPIVTELRSKYLQASKSESELTAKLGPNHVQVQNLRKEMREYERLILDEIGRLAESARSEAQIAADRSRALEVAVNEAVGVNVADSTQMVHLSELERDALSYRNIYQAYQTRYQETIQQQSFPVTEARVITPAYRPSEKSGPRTGLIVAGALVLGLGMGGGIGLLREMRDRAFRNAAQVREMLGLELLGNLPNLPALKPIAAPKETDPRVVLTNKPSLTYTIDAPLTRFAESLRSVKVAVDLSTRRKSPILLGIVSLLPGEGKTTVAKNLASLIASQGVRTLLIDGDLRNPDLTRSLAPHAQAGLPEVLFGNAELRDVLMSEPRSGLAFLPGATHRRIAHTSELLGSDGMRSLLESLSGSYDYIVIDLPPMGPVVDARAVSPFLDRFLFVIEWGKTPMEVANETLAHEIDIAEKCIGALLTKVNMKKLKLYDDYTNYVYDKRRDINYYQEG